MSFWWRFTQAIKSAISNASNPPIEATVADAKWGPSVPAIFAPTSATYTWSSLLALSRTKSFG